MMKIALFIKPYTTKACFLFLLIIYSVATPAYAHANFFSTMMTKVLGTETQAEAQAPLTQDSAHNSQTLPLPESSINPDMKSIQDTPVVTIVSDEALLSSTSPLGSDRDLEKDASSEKISVYVVKKGDNLDSIAKKLKVSKDTIIASNADLKKSDLLAIGQSLVILGLKPSVSTTDSTDKTPDTSPKAVATKKVVEKPKDVAVKVNQITETAPVVNTAVPAPQAPVQVAQIETPLQTPIINTPADQVTSTEPQALVPENPEPSGQPTGTINGGYIWPFPAGIGRVSQGLHADNAYDFSAPKGTPIFAVQNGTVLIAHPSGYNGGYGLYVVINFDDGRQAIFGHMSKVVVDAGQVVKQGDIIGYVGNTGKSTGPHTHIGFHGGLGNPYLGLKVNSTGLENHD